MNEDLIERIRHDAECLAVDCRYAEKAHFAYSTALRRTALWGGAVAAILAAEAGLSGVGDFLPSFAIGILALISTVITTFITAAKPGELAEQHHVRGVDFNILRLKLRRFIHIDLVVPNVETETIVERLTDLAQQKAELAKQQPHTPSGVWLRFAKRRAGEPSYEKDEALAAIGSPTQ